MQLELHVRTLGYETCVLTVPWWQCRQVWISKNARSAASTLLRELKQLQVSENDFAEIVFKQLEIKCHKTQCCNLWNSERMLLRVMSSHVPPKVRHPLRTTTCSLRRPSMPNMQIKWSLKVPVSFDSLLNLQPCEAMTDVPPICSAAAS